MPPMPDGGRIGALGLIVLNRVSCKPWRKSPYVGSLPDSTAAGSTLASDAALGCLASVLGCLAGNTKSTTSSPVASFEASVAYKVVVDAKIQAELACRALLLCIAGPNQQLVLLFAWGVDQLQATCAYAVFIQASLLRASSLYCCAGPHCK